MFEKLTHFAFSLFNWRTAILLLLIPPARWYYYWREARFVKDMRLTYGSFFHEYAQLPQDEYDHFLDPTHPALAAITKLRKNKSHYISLVKKAGFYDSKTIITHHPVPGGRLRITYVVAELVDNGDPGYIKEVLDSFDNIIGYYEDRARESFDLFFWVRSFFTSPKSAFDFFRKAFTGK